MMKKTPRNKTKKGMYTISSNASKEDPDER